MRVTSVSSHLGTRDVTGVGNAGGVDGTKEILHGGKAHAVAPDIFENVAISGKAQEVIKAQDIARATPDIDSEKIARLKSAIQAGTYAIDVDKVADKLVAEHLSTAISIG